MTEEIATSHHVWYSMFLQLADFAADIWNLVSFISTSMENECMSWNNFSSTLIHFRVRQISY